MACHTWIARRLRRHTMTLGYGGVYGQSLLRRMSALEQTASGIRHPPSAQGRIAANEFALTSYFILYASDFIGIGFL
jgi:hypothetical protein